MTINNFFSDVLSSIADAQHKSYVFSQHIGEQASDSLFPVPVAEIREITFDMKFAYLAQEDTEQTELLPLNIYNRLEHTFSTIVVKIQKDIIDEADLIDISGDIDWISMKRSLLQRKLLPAVLAAIKENFLSAPGVIREGILQVPELQYVLIKSISSVLLDHPQLQWLTRYIQPAAIVQRAVTTAGNDYKEAWLQAAAAARTPVIKGAEIIMDAARLKELPMEMLQQARVVLDVRNILKQNEWTP